MPSDQGPVTTPGRCPKKRHEFPQLSLPGNQAGEPISEENPGTISQEFEKWHASNTLLKGVPISAICATRQWGRGSDREKGRQGDRETRRQTEHFEQN